MEPLLSFQAQLEEEVARYENGRRRNFAPLTDLTHSGRLPIALRSAIGLSRRELAQRLGVGESQVSRDERNEYRGITVERAQPILDALGERVQARVEARDLVREREPALAD